MKKPKETGSRVTNGARHAGRHCVLISQHHRDFSDPAQSRHGSSGVKSCTTKRRSRSIAERGEVAEKNAMTGVCRAEGGIRMRPSGGRGVERVVLRRPQRPLAEPRGGRPGHAPPPPRPFGSVWRQCCGHCQPRSKRTLTSSSAVADAVSQSIPVLPGKGKGEETRKQTFRTSARTMRGFCSDNRKLRDYDREHTRSCFLPSCENRTEELVRGIRPRCHGCVVGVGPDFEEKGTMP